MIRLAIQAGVVSQDGRGPIGRFYAGAPGHVNKPDDCALVGLGPLPVGVYQMGPPIDDPDVGQFAIPLTQIQGNTYNRSAFLWHGDNASKAPESSSRGCPISPRSVREIGAADPDQLLTVTP